MPPSSGAYSPIPPVVESNWQTIDYTNELPGSVTLDSEEWRLYTGATWDATAKTTGSVRVGYLTKDFTASDYQDYSSIGWEANLQGVRGPTPSSTWLPAGTRSRVPPLCRTRWLSVLSASTGCIIGKPT